MISDAPAARIEGVLSTLWLPIPFTTINAPWYFVLAAFVVVVVLPIAAIVVLILLAGLGAKSRD